jgi:Zn-dependent protease with chaperone function
VERGPYGRDLSLTLRMRALSGLNAFFIVSVRAHRFVLNMDHPPLEKRLARLAEIARELGKAVR